MKIDFNSMPKNSVANFKGGELHADIAMHVDDLNRILSATLVPGASIGTHTHEDSSEIIFIISGDATVICDGQEEHLTAGQCHYCPKGSTHTMMNRSDADLRFMAVVPKQ